MTAEAQVTWVEDRRFVGRSGSGHAIVVDGSGNKLGPSPMELVLIGLVGCTAYDVLDILEKKQQSVTGLRVQVRAERATEPPRVYTELAIDYTVRGHNLQAKAIADAIQLSVDKYCSVSAMLGHTAEITTGYHVEEPAVQG